MISDSPYQLREPTLTPGAGILAGLLGGLAMFLVITVAGPLSGLELKRVLFLIGGLLSPKTAGHPADGSLWMTGLIFHAALGSLCGLLYALCQLRAPTRGLIGVGVFYGFLLWITGNLVLVLFFGGAERGVFHSWAWLLACVVYGLCLALASVWRASRHRGEEKPAVPLD